MAHKHPSGLPDAYDRSPERPDWARVVFREGAVSQAAELNELQSVIERRNRRVSDRLMADGHRVDGAEIIVDGDTVTLTDGLVYARGDIRVLSAAAFTEIPTSGEVVVGVRIVSSIVTEEDDPALLGLHPGTEAEGEPGAAREAETAVWGWDGDGEDGDLYQVYLLKDGQPVDQSRPSSMSDVSLALADYDRDAHGSYVVRGCEVTALGKIGGAQHFSIAEGVANILGFKRARNYALRHAEPETFDTAPVAAESHTVSGSGAVVVNLNRGPLADVVTVVIEKEKTSTITKGAAGTADLLPEASIKSIVEVKQGGTTYAAGTDYVLNADRVDWSPSGAEPAAASTYTVKYRYMVAITPDETGMQSVTVSGGVSGGTVQISYTYKLPRADLLCLDAQGSPVYVYGTSAETNPRAPQQPSALLALAEIVNDWRGKPEVINTDVRSISYKDMWAYVRKIYDYGDMIALERLKSDIDAREPVAKKGVFVDPWVDDYFRDQGEAQTAAIFDGAMQLGVDPTVYSIGPSAVQTLPFTEQVVINQPLATGCMKINPYQNFAPLPIGFQIVPPVDFWVAFETEWASPVTQMITNTQRVVAATARPTRTVTASSSSTAAVGQRVEAAPNLRQIPITFTIKGLSPGEVVSSLTFDGVSVKPATVVGDTNGEATGTFTIPAGIPAGTKRVEAITASGRRAAVNFTGQGRVEVTVLRTTTTVTNTIIETVDPLAQTFSLTVGRFIVGADFRLCAIGNRANGLTVEIRAVENGVPTDEILAQTNFSMAGTSVGQWIKPRFAIPVWLHADREYAVVVKTDDANHSLSIATLGDFDAAAQRYVSAQPYSVGVLLSSANARTWTPHQKSDLTFRLVAAAFTSNSLTVNLGTVSVSGMTDLLVLAGVETPLDAVSVVFELTMPGGAVVRVRPEQPWPLTESVTGSVAVKAILTGGPRVSPILFPHANLIAGKIRTSGTYISRVMDFGSSVRLSAFLKAFLPAGSSMAVEIQPEGGSWTSLTQHAATVLADGWVEREYRKTGVTADRGRVRVTINGGPGARPILTDMRATAI